MERRNLIPTRLQRGTSGIVLRLRSVLVVIGIVIAFAGISTFWQTKSILQAHKRLDNIALPLLAQAHQSQREFAALSGVLDRASAASSADALHEMDGEVAAAVQQLRQRIHGLAQFNVPADVLETMQKRLEAAHHVTANVLSLKAAIWEVHDIERAIILDMQDMQTSSRLALEILSFRNTAEIETVLKSVRNDAGDTPYLAEQLFSDLLFKELNINEISTRLEAIFEQARNAYDLERGPSQIRLREDLSKRLYDLAILLSRMPATPERATLAKVIAKTQKLVVAPEGLLERYGTELALKHELEKASAVRADLIERISDTANDLVVRALADVGKSSAQLQQAVFRLTYVLAAAFFLAIAVTAATLFWIVERQINRRMKRLNAEVRATAAGDLEQNITVTGADELGDMARALKVFKQNAVELRRSNVELEKFAYVAAHDLRSPLRAIRDLAGWIQEDEDNKFSPESTAYLSLLLARTDRLNQLLNDLLHYARAGQVLAPPKPIDLEALVRQLAMECDPEHRFAIRCDLPSAPVYTYVTPLTQIISNLLSNAIKHHDRDSGTIDISAKISKGFMQLRIRDDGPGIDPKYHARVFDLFQTLRPRDEVEGSGLGLAIVSKLASRFGGKVSLHSDPASERGACFTVELPVQAVTSNATKPAQRAAA